MEPLKEERYKKIRILIVFLLMNLCFYGIFSVEHFAADTYVSENVGWADTAALYFSNGRWLMTLICLFSGFFHISFAVEKTLSWAMSIIFLSLAELVIYGLLKKRTRIEEKYNLSWLLMIFSSFMMISNLFVLEYFIFPEYTGAICLGIFFNILEVKFVLKFLEGGSWKSFVLGVFLGTIGMMGHQGAFGITEVLLILLAKDTFANVKMFVKNTVVIGGAYLIPCVANVILTKLAGSARVAGKLQILESLKAAVGQIADLLMTTANFMPKYVYFVMCIIAGGAVLVLVIMKKDIKRLLHVFYVAVVFLLAVISPFLMTEAVYISVVPRTVYVMGAGMGIILILYLLLEDKSRIRIYAAAGYAVLFLGIQYFNTCQMETSHYVSVGIDYYDVNYIAQQVWIYENDTGNQINRICIYTDDSPLGIYYGLTGYGAINERVMSNTWAAGNVYKRFTGTDYIIEEGDPQVYEQYFKGKNWHYLDDEQIVFIGDTLHLCLY